MHCSVDIAELWAVGVDENKVATKRINEVIESQRFRMIVLPCLLTLYLAKTHMSASTVRSGAALWLRLARASMMALIFVMVD
jgi:hypothetical protein